MIVHFRRYSIISSPVSINNQAVEQVPQQKSVCVVIDDMLTFEPQVGPRCKKEGCIFIGNLGFFWDADNSFMRLFYVLCFS